MSKHTAPAIFVISSIWPMLDFIQHGANLQTAHTTTAALWHPQYGISMAPTMTVGTMAQIGTKGLSN